MLARTEEAGSGLARASDEEAAGRAPSRCSAWSRSTAPGKALARAGRQAGAQRLADRRSRRRGSRTTGARRAGRASARAGVKVTEVLGDPLAPRAFSLIAIHKHGIPQRLLRGDAGRSRARGHAAAERRSAARTCATCRSSPSIPPTRATTTTRSGPSPTGEGGFRAVVAIADVSLLCAPRRRARPRSEQARQLGLFPRPGRADAARSAQRRRLLAARPARTARRWPAT